MTMTEARKRGLAVFLAAMLLFSPVLQASAQEIPEAGQETSEIPRQEESQEPPQVNPEQPETLEQPETPEQPENPEQPETPEQPENPEQPEIPEQPETPEQPENPEQPETPEQPENPERPENPEEPENPEQPETPEQPENPEQPETPEQPENPEQAENPEQPENPEGSELQEASGEPEQMEEIMLWSVSPVVTVADVLQLLSEESAITGGTVVYVNDTLAVLQDETGGIRLSFSGPADIGPGDVLLVAGHRSSGGFAVEEFEKTATGALPVQAADLSEGRDALRILVKGATLGEQSLSQNGYSCRLVGTVPDGIAPGDRVDAWGVMLDGEFFADTIAASENQEPEARLVSGWNFYFGQLHAHTNLSDGRGSVEEAFAHAAGVENLDFFAVTDHSNSFDNAEQGSLNTNGAEISREWAAGKAAAQAVTDESFVGIFGYEMTWPSDLAIGHINTFGTPGWQTRDQPGMDTLKGYLDALAAVPDAVSQFNHPGGDFGDFRSFADYSPQYDARVHLLEVGGEGSFTAYGAFTTALDAGWHLAPSTSQNNHNKNWGSESPDRTVVLARELTEEAIYDAIRNYRVYATEDADLKIEYHLNDRIMGSTIGEAAALRADIQVEDGSGDPIGRVEVVTEGGKKAGSVTVEEAYGECSLDITTRGSYYYLRILRDDKIVAVTAPVWVDTYEDLGIAGFTADKQKPLQGTEAQLNLTLYNHEDIPFQVDSVVFSIGGETIETVTAPGAVAPVGELEIPLTYIQETAGAVTITATVTGTIAELKRSFQKSLTLYYQAPKAEPLPIGQVRSGMLGEAYRIRGYATAGTSKPCNTFPDSIYLQDDSGGIEITDFTQEGIQLGTPMEIAGVLRSVGGNLVLAMTDYEILDADYYRYVPRTMTHEVAMNYDTHGGQLLQVEGHVVSLTRTADGLGVSRFTIRDIVGDLATVIIEDGIGSGAYGTNALSSEVKLSGTTRAMGLLHIDEYGKTVLRVRNCDEVVYVPPVNDPSNPKTHDWLQRWLLRK